MNTSIVRYVYANLRAGYAMLPTPGIQRPIFIIGCGRSGTTILGKALSQHRQIKFLNEPRTFWSAAYPKTDIWTRQADVQKGELALTESDFDVAGRNKLSRLFRFETLVSRKPVLIEKLPINAFRLQFIKQNFPDARFIYLYRNGLDVARSMATLCKKGLWVVYHPFKLEKLLEYAHKREESRSLPSLCSTHFDRGLLEWRLSNEAAVDFFQVLPSERYVELSYRELIDNPVVTLTRVLRFIGIDENDRAVSNFATEKIARRTNEIGLSELSEKYRQIGGPLLLRSMDRTSGLSKSISNATI